MEARTPRVMSLGQERRNGAIATSFSPMGFYRVSRKEKLFELIFIRILPSCCVFRWESAPGIWIFRLAIEQQVRVNAVTVASHAKVIVENSHPGINVIINGEPAVC